MLVFIQFSRLSLFILNINVKRCLNVTTRANGSIDMFQLGAVVLSDMGSKGATMNVSVFYHDKRLDCNRFTHYSKQMTKL